MKKSKLLRRKESITEIEFLWENDLLIRDRVMANDGFWNLENEICTHGSLKSRFNFKKYRVILKKDASEFRKLLHAFKTVKITWIQRKKSIDENHFTQAAWYFEVKLNCRTFTLLLPIDSSQSINKKNIKNELSKWSEDLFCFESLPEISGDISVRLLEFSPQALGCFFHEALGHALENPLFDDSIKLKSQFDVEDIPGNLSLWGYCPFDDMGTVAKKTSLLLGRNGKTTKLSPQNGHMRATSWVWHPIIRQRCLNVKALSETPTPTKKNTLYLGEVHMGQWCDETKVAELESIRAVLICKDGKRFKLPPLRIRLSIFCIKFLRPFGESKSWNPGGGCHKDLQRGLPVSFTAPSAWIDLNKLTKNYIEVIL